MSKTKTVTEQTIHGEVEYSVVECDSCGNEVRKEEASHFIIGDVNSSRYKFGRKQVRFEKGEELVTGWACPYCRDSGPMAFPSLTSVDKARRVIDWWFFDRYSLSFRGIVTLVIAFTVFLTGVLL